MIHEAVGYLCNLKSASEGKELNLFQVADKTTYRKRQRIHGFENGQQMYNPHD